MPFWVDISLRTGFGRSVCGSSSGLSTEASSYSHLCSESWVVIIVKPLAVLELLLKWSKPHLSPQIRTIKAGCCLVACFLQKPSVFWAVDKVNGNISTGCILDALHFKERRDSRCVSLFGILFSRGVLSEASGCWKSHCQGCSFFSMAQELLPGLRLYGPLLKQVPCRIMFPYDGSTEDAIITEEIEGRYPQVMVYLLVVCSRVNYMAVNRSGALKLGCSCLFQQKLC